MYHLPVFYSHEDPEDHMTTNLELKMSSDRTHQDDLKLLKHSLKEKSPII